MEGAEIRAHIRKALNKISQMGWSINIRKYSKGYIALDLPVGKH